jgi:transposase
MERHYQNAVICYPQHGEVHLSAVHPARLERLSEKDAFPWSGTDYRLTKTAVFVERFFHKVPYKALAEQFGVEENTIVSIYSQAVEQIGRIVEALDARREGLRAVKASPFTEEQRYFLLVCVFGFSRAEVARMFKCGRDHVWRRVKHLEDRYAALFAGNGNGKEQGVEDPPMPAKLTRADVLRMVEAYTEQGLSHRQAFKRIAARYAKTVRRPVSYRGIESRYYKAVAHGS